MLYAYINGERYKLAADFSITEQIGNSTASTVTVLVESQPVPVAGDVIQIKDDGTGAVLFYGTCGIPKSPKYTSLYQPKAYSITCGNANSILENRIANVAYQGKTMGEIVRLLYERYIAAEGVTIGRISEITATLEVYTASNYNLKAALNELADLVQATWKITNGKEFVFVVRDDFAVFPETINAGFLLGTELQHTTKDYNLRTVQIISGATDTTDPQTEIFTYDGEQKAFVTVYPLSARPAVYVNGVRLNDSQVGVAGLNDQDEGVVFLFSYNSKNLNYNEQTEYLQAGDTVRVEYVGLFSIRVSVSNAEKIDEIARRTGTSGIVERVQIANTVKNTDDAVTLGLSLLEQFCQEEGELTFWLKSEQLYANGYTLEDVEPLTLMRFNLPEIGVVGDFVITERTITPLIKDLSEDAERRLKVTLKLRDRDYLKSYGEIIRDLERDVAQLSIREDEIVVDVSTINEPVKMVEEYSLAQDIAYYACNGLDNGSLFSPCDFGGAVYPSGVAAYPLVCVQFLTPEALEYAEVLRCELVNAFFACAGVHNGSLFAPCDLGNAVYPI